MEKLENENILTTRVRVVGIRKIEYKKKDGSDVKGIKVFFNKYPKITDDNKGNIIGLEIDENNNSIYMTGLDRWSEFSNPMIKYPCDAILKQELISMDRPLRFVDIKIS
jgi:hypothetical protein